MARRGRKRHVQQELFRHGGRRKGAGRKPKHGRAGAAHKTRPAVDRRHPQHITLRVVSTVGNLRRRRLYKAVRDASIMAAIRERIRVVHISIQRTHVHLLVEAEDKAALSRGMQGFQVSVARNVNTALGDRCRRRRGRVFADRYHAVAITSPRQARAALGYVLNNWRHHAEDAHGVPRTWRIDPFSSAIWFPDWQELEGRAFLWPTPATYDPLVVRRPQSWLLSEGWKKNGGRISVRDVPGGRSDS